MDYEKAIERAEKARLEGIDIYALEADEWQEMLNCLQDGFKNQLSHPAKRQQKDTFQCMGVKFIKQANTRTNGE